ncbi:hypothetical protein RZS08_44415, partial [Arthrospira platensis SPKY1]|nr:hypothetical protein [Arthrospira platensis SPKY1]
MVRDRLGVKPLYYHFAGKTLRFASSMKALFAFKAVARVLDHSAAAHYLRTIRTTLGRQTLIKGIYALGPGESLLWRPGSTNYVEPSVYWNLLTLSRADGQRGLSFSDACEETKERF